MAAQHALRENSPTWAFGLFARLLDLADGEVDDELVSRFFVDCYSVLGTLA